MNGKTISQYFKGIREELLPNFIGVFSLHIYKLIICYGYFFKKKQREAF